MLTTTYSAVSKTGGVAATLAFNGNLADYTAAGGAGYFANQIATALGVEPYQVEIVSAKQGSIIVIFKVYTIASDPSTTNAVLATNIAAALTSGLNIYGTEITAYDINAISLTGCSKGYYLDSASVCRSCPDGCKTCTSGSDKCTNVGAIVGGVIGGVALIVIIVIIYLKREAIKKMVSPKSYNKVASTPTNVAQKA